MFHWWNLNNRDELIQKTAWRLVRSADDKLKGSLGIEKLGWCVSRISELFPREKQTFLEDYVRSAYVNFQIETGSYERSGL